MPAGLAAFIDPKDNAVSGAAPFSLPGSALAQIVERNPPGRDSRPLFEVDGRRSAPRRFPILRKLAGVGVCFVDPIVGGAKRLIIVGRWTYRGRFR